MRDIKISAKKQKLFDEFDNTPYYIGEEISIIPAELGEYGSKHSETVTIVSIGDKSIMAKRERFNELIEVPFEKIKGRYDKYKIGANPFVEKYRSVRSINYSMDSIIFTLELSEKRRDEDWEIIPGVIAKEVCWNPFVYDKDATASARLGVSVSVPDTPTNRSTASARLGVSVSVPE